MGYYPTIINNWFPSSRQMDEMSPERRQSLRQRWHRLQVTGGRLDQWMEFFGGQEKDWNNN